MRIRNALISVSDKSGLKELAAALTAAGAKLYSTGGTAAALQAAGHDPAPIESLTGGDGELLGGRVKTLHSNVHAAVLADPGEAAHMQALAERGLPKLDLVVVNFYPFEQAAADAADAAAVIENIDIGGPALVRAAAKNHAGTIVLTDPNDYPVFIGHLKNNTLNADARRQFAAKAFVNVAHLDAAIANHFSKSGDSGYPSHQFIHLEKITDLAYGENPHQPAACYRLAGDRGGFTQLHGPPLSYNNLLDAHSAWLAACMHNTPAAAIVKHNNPCGVAVADTLRQALARAFKTDSQAAFGGVVAFNRPLDEDTALLLQDSFWEVVIAPQVDDAAKGALALKERLRLVLAPQATAQRHVASCGRLVLLQTTDSIDGADDAGADSVVSQRKPSDAEMRDLRFAWRVAAVVKSNAIVLARRQATVGIGAGQMSRLDSARLACEKAARVKLKTAGSVAASDGFFPFPDGVETLAAAGVTAIIQPGGSKNDPAIIQAADAAGIAMLMTRKRHFRH